MRSMRETLLLMTLSLSLTSFAQDLPTDTAGGFAFPLGCRFTIKMYPVDSIRYNYSVIAIESFMDVIDLFDNDSLFSSEGEEGTIDFVFCLGTRGDTEKEREENMKVLLLFRNRTKYSYSYISEIQRQEEGEFEETSNIGTYAGIMGTEMWPYMIYAIGLRDFRIRE